jgi:hypothetical protein
MFYIQFVILFNNIKNVFTLRLEMQERERKCRSLLSLFLSISIYNSGMIEKGETKKRRKKWMNSRFLILFSFVRTEVDSFMDWRNLPRDWKTSWWWWTVYIREEESGSFFFIIIFIHSKKKKYCTAHVFIYTLHTIYLFEHHSTMTRNCYEE